MSAARQAAHSDTSSTSVAPAHGSATVGWVVGLSTFAGIMMIAMPKLDVDGVGLAYDDVRRVIQQFRDQRHGRGGLGGAPGRGPGAAGLRPQRS